MKSTTLNLTWEHERVMNLVSRTAARSTVRDGLWVSRMPRPGAREHVQPAVSDGRQAEISRHTALAVERVGAVWARSGEGLAYGALAVSSAGVLIWALWQALNTMA
jgi:hypothetical protein